MIRISKIALGMLVLFLLFVSLGSLVTTSEIVKDKAATPITPVPIATTPVAFAPIVNINDLPLQDNKNVFQYDDPGSVVVVYITARKGNLLENTNYTWTEVNAFSKWTNGSRSANDIVGEAEVIVQFGDESGPLPGELGYGAVVPNGTIQIRGASSSSSKHQKSYKIELFEGAGNWRGQTTFALNKHIYDISRIRNKLSFDLMKLVPNMLSLRTQFVHLYVKDETATPVSTKFVDLGLFTQVEQVNKTFLKNHLLDRNAQLYKATSFEFDRYADQIRMADDPLYNEAEFSHRLEIKGSRDHSKLIQMLDDITNEEIPIEQSFEKYFDSDNYFTWMAFNILVGNVDTQNQNFFLYSPQNSEKWYFLPWDYDDSLFRQRRTEAGEYPYLPWEVGIANYWGGILHNRVMRSDVYRQKLTDKMNELITILTPERIQSLLDIYRPVVEPIIFSLPDVRYLPGSKAEFNSSYSLIPSEIQNNYNLYLETLNMPMPFYLGTPVVSAGVLTFEWEEAYNFTPQSITYHFEVSRDPRFTSIIYQADTVNVTTLDVPLFDPGNYFWRVLAVNEAGKVQYAFDDYEDADGYPYGGLKLFTITPDGDVTENSK
ncbi:MAG: CotH kinase family protein [Anaerolineales bacterium]